MGHEDWDRLWTPHRIPYILGENRPKDTDAGPHCPFCRAAQQEMTAITADLERTFPENDSRGAFVEPLAEVVFGGAHYTVLLGRQEAEFYRR